MRQITLSDNDKFELRSTPEFFGVVEGLMLLVGGIVIVLYGYGWIRSNRMTHLVTPYYVELAGELMAAAGAYLLLRRRGATFDRRRGTVERWWGLGCFPLLWSTRPLAADAVRVDQRRIYYRRARVVYYPLSLVKSGRRLRLAVGFNYQKTRRVAESLAAFLGLRFESAC